MDKISVVVPVYNREKVLEKSVDTLLKQSYDNIEVIIINDGSTDNTKKVCEKIANKDRRVVTKTIENFGVSNARNTGIEMATGKYITFMDSDDFVGEDYIKNLYSPFNDNVDLVCSGFQYVDKDDKMLFCKKPENMNQGKEEYYRVIEMLQDCVCFNSSCNKLFRRDIIVDNNIKMDTRISMGEDLLFVIDYLSCCNQNFITIDALDYHYFLSDSGLQANFENGLELRLSQNRYLETLYDKNGYNKNGLYNEYIRVFYISVIESNGDKAVIKRIFETEEFKRLKDLKIICSKKFNIFFKILKTKNTFLIATAVKLFGLTKSISGKSFKW